MFRPYVLLLQCMQAHIPYILRSMCKTSPRPLTPSSLSDPAHPLNSQLFVRHLLLEPRERLQPALHPHSDPGIHEVHLPGLDNVELLLAVVELLAAERGNLLDCALGGVAALGPRDGSQLVVCGGWDVVVLCRSLEGVP